MSIELVLFRLPSFDHVDLLVVPFDTTFYKGVVLDVELFQGLWSRGNLLVATKPTEEVRVLLELVVLLVEVIKHNSTSWDTMIREVLEVGVAKLICSDKFTTKAVVFTF